MKKLICVVLCCLLLTGCGPQTPTGQQTLYCMNTVMDITVWGADSAAAITAVAGLLQGLEKEWSVTDPASALQTGSFSPRQQALLDWAEALSSRTGGAFSPHLRSVSALWGFYNEENTREDFRIPTRDAVAAALADPQWDMGGILKGYAGEEAVRLLKELDVDCALLNLGGNIQTYGAKPDGTPWKIAVQDPNGGDYLGVLSVEGTMAVVTSGDYQRFFERDGVRYHHILDPKTGYPADSGIRSVTVICKSGTTADALSTGLLVMDLEEATALWRASDDFEAVFVMADGRILVTEGVSITGCSCEVISR